MAGDVPGFERRFSSGAHAITRIGSGALGGKASGLVAIHDVLAAEFPPEKFEIAVQVPRMTVVATDFFDEFMAQNGLDGLDFESMPDERIAQAFQRAELPVELVGDLESLVRDVHTPLAIRSSSLLEDALEQPFAGVYGTKMIPNNQHDPDVRFRRLLEAIKFVYASTYFREARDYVRAADADHRHEKMAVIVQEVVGQRRGHRFYPELSGVARSYNFYPSAQARPEEGVVNLALGLGKTIVDGGVSWSYTPSQPRRTPPFSSVRQYLTDTQTAFWAINMERMAFYDPVNEAEYLVEASLAEAESDESLRYVASTYDGARDRITPGVGLVGPRVVNFAPLLVLGEFPVNDVVRALLASAEHHTGAKVEIEFAMTFETPRDASPRASLGFLQVRPMAVSDALVDVPESELEAPGTLAASTTVMGNGVRTDIADIVYVRPDAFEPAMTPVIAREVEILNRRLVDEGRPYLLIGFGRWGSSHPSLGIPVNWSQISGARAILETTLPEINVEPSQGSHFFHNLTAFHVSYFTMHHEGCYRVDWAWLAAQPAVAETRFLRHVRPAAGIEVRVDGRTGRGVVRHGE